MKSILIFLLAGCLTIEAMTKALPDNPTEKDFETVKKNETEKVDGKEDNKNYYYKGKDEPAELEESPYEPPEYELEYEPEYEEYETEYAEYEPEELGEKKDSENYHHEGKYKGGLVDGAEANNLQGFYFRGKDDGQLAFKEPSVANYYRRKDEGAQVVGAKRNEDLLYNEVKEKKKCEEYEKGGENCGEDNGGDYGEGLNEEDLTEWKKWVQETKDYYESLNNTNNGAFGEKLRQEYGKYSEEEKEEERDEEEEEEEDSNKENNGTGKNSKEENKKSRGQKKEDPKEKSIEQLSKVDGAKENEDYYLEGKEKRKCKDYDKRGESCGKDYEYDYEDIETEDDEDYETFLKLRGYGKDSEEDSKKENNGTEKNSKEENKKSRAHTQRKKIPMKN